MLVIIGIGIYSQVKDEAPVDPSEKQEEKKNTAQDKKTDTKEQELFKQLVFECEIVNDIGKCDLNIGVDRTIFILEQLGFKWEKVGREEIIRAYHAIRESKKSGKKQY